MFFYFDGNLHVEILWWYLEHLSYCYIYICYTISLQSYMGFYGMSLKIRQVTQIEGIYLTIDLFVINFDASSKQEPPD